MALKRHFFLFVFCMISYTSIAEAGDKEIWPIPTECPKTDPIDYTVHLQHESDCTKFYKCDHGGKVLFDCPDGLHFNPVLQVCDWPYRANCTLNDKTTTEAPPAPPVDKDPECPWPDPLNYTVHLPHETDCTKFYKCDHGKKVEFDCPDNLHFNPVLEVCDWPKDAGCEDVKPEPEPTQKPTPSETPEPPKPEPTPPADKDPECPWPDPLNYTVHLPHETDCTKFYKCDNGKKVEFDCPDNLHFNPVLEVCDWPKDAGCEDVKPEPEPTQKPTPSDAPEPPKPEPTPPTDKDPECPWPDPLNYTVHLPHENDCTKFYKCDNGKKVEFDCPDDLHFNPVLEVCDWPQDAGCQDNKPDPTPDPPKPTPSETPKPETPKPEPTPPSDKDPECPWPDPLNYTVHLPHETDCTKFYKCDNGKKVEFDCPDNLHFNPVLEVCDWPKDAGCEDVKPDPEPTQKPTPSEAPEPTPAADKDPECPWPDPLNYTVHLPHETDCTKFYKCDNGKKVEFDCPDDLHFNPVLEVCDWPQDAGCQDNKPDPTPDPPKPTPSETPEPEPTPPADKDPECPWPDPLNYTVHLPHETDCTKFYKCDNGKKVEFDCPDNLHFNPVLEVCDWPGNARCEDVKPEPEPTQKPTPSETPEPPKPEPTPPADKNPECPWPDPLNYTVHLPHECDCTKFYKCDNGKKVEFDCPDNLHFNPVLEVCDWPENAGCENNNPEPTQKPSSEGPEPPKPTPPADRDPECPWPDPLNYTVHLPHETDCTKFYKCDNGKKVEFDCPNNLHFNPVLEVCDWPGNAGCEDNNPKPTQKPSSEAPEPTPPADRDPECPWPDPLNYTVHLPHETDCTKFYKCDNGKKVEFDCPDNLHFNPVLEVCDWPGNAGCEDIKPVPTQKPTSSEAPEPPKPTPPADRDPECPWPDPLNYTVHLPHETDCTKFYKCDNGKKVEFDCPDDLHFNPVLEVCDWPGNAGCEDIKPVPTQKPTSSEAPEPSKPTPPADRDPECPWPDPLNYTVHLPHETDCTKFYKCDNGKKVEFDCPDDLHFNPVLEVCDWPGNAGCEDITPPNKCPEIDCQDTTLYLPVLSNPREYIRCVGGVEIINTCPGGLVFDKNLATCNLEHLVAPN